MLEEKNDNLQEADGNLANNQNDLAPTENQEIAIETSEEATETISEEVEMLGTIRTFSKSDEELVFERIRQIVTKTAEAAGATAELKLPYSSYNPVTFNDVALTEAMLPSLQKTAGKENVNLVPAVTGAEDFSFYQEKVPGLYFFVGGMKKGQDPDTVGPHHTPQFLIEDSAFLTGMNALCNLVFDYIALNKK